MYTHHAAIGAGDDALAANHVRKTHQALRHEFRMLNDVCGMTDDTRHQGLAVRQPVVPENLPFMLMPRKA